MYLEYGGHDLDGAGDTSDDLNWYSNARFCPGVFKQFPFWLGDESEGMIATKEFVDRRIANVMQFEKTKSQVKSWRIYEAFAMGQVVYWIQ